MSLHRLVEDFAKRCEQCQSPNDLLLETEAVARELGFSRLAMVHGMWFRQPSQRLIRLDNFGDWAEIFITRKYYLNDPALLSAQRTNNAFAWHQMSKLIPFGHRQSKVLAEARRHGLRAGFTVPIGVMGEPHGCCSFASSKSQLPSRPCQRAATLIGSEAFCAARRLYGYPAHAYPVPRLSPRKLECLRYVSCGKTDGEIATILGLSEPTIRTYMTLLRRDFDVVSRAQLTAAALRFGFISYDDAIPAF